MTRIIQSEIEKRKHVYSLDDVHVVSFNLHVLCIVGGDV